MFVELIFCVSGLSGVVVVHINRNETKIGGLIAMTIKEMVMSHEVDSMPSDALQYINNS